jgi:HK97 family phage major capsid protein
MQDLGLEVEDQVMAGPGGGETFLGILNDPDIPTVGAGGDGLNTLDRLRRAKRDVMLNGRTIPNGAVLHPNDAEKVDTLKATGSGEYFGGGPFGSPGQRTVWGLPIVESDVVPDGTAVVGDFRRAVLFERQATEISLGTVGDDFIRNIVRVLAEYRAAFALTRPKAFVEVNLAAAP